MIEVIPVRDAARAFIDAQEAGEQLYRVHGSEPIQGDIRTFSWTDYAAVVDQLVGSASAVVDPDYEVIEWADLNDVYARPVRDSLLFLNMINHGERICDGLIAALIERGFVLAAARRIVGAARVA